MTHASTDSSVSEAAPSRNASPGRDGGVADRRGRQDGEMNSNPAGRLADDYAMQVVLLGARLHLSERAKRRLQALLQRKPDWERVLSLSLRHRVRPLLHRTLSAAPFTSEVPEDVRAALRASFRGTGVHGLLQERALVQVLASLREQGIKALPFKGATLAERVYGNIALRPFGDLDILVLKKHFDQARSLLRAKGFHALKEMDAREEAVYFQREKSYELVRENILVELHWFFLHPMHGFRLDPARAWERTEQIAMGGASVSVLAPEDLLLYLCAHGAKHFWERLSWICDVAESLRVYHEEIDWPVLIRRARALNAERMLLLGLRLAVDLLGAPCPTPILRLARSRRVVGELEAYVCNRLIEEVRAPNDDLTFDEALFHLRMRERLRDKWPYCRQLARLALEPSEKDRVWVALPPTLDFAYYAVRPVRALWDRLMRLFDRSSGPF